RCRRISRELGTPTCRAWRWAGYCYRGGCVVKRRQSDTWVGRRRARVCTQRVAIEIEYGLTGDLEPFASLPYAGWGGHRHRQRVVARCPVAMAYTHPHRARSIPEVPSIGERSTLWIK